MCRSCKPASCVVSAGLSGPNWRHGFPGMRSCVSWCISNLGWRAARTVSTHFDVKDDEDGFAEDIV